MGKKKLKQIAYNVSQLNEVADFTSKLNLKNKIMNTDKILLEAQNQPSCLGAVSGSLHYDEKLLIDLWYKRNPCHELNSNSGEDMFWKTAFMVFEDYLREVSRNDR